MQLGEIEEERLVDKFIHGLKPKTRTEVELQDPQILEETNRIADHFDIIVYNRSFFGPPQSVHQEDTRGEPMQLDTLRMARIETSIPVQIDAFRTKTQPSKLKKLTNDERAHLRSINACFKCRKQGHIARECPTKANRPNSTVSRPGCLCWSPPRKNTHDDLDSIIWCPHDTNYEWIHESCYDTCQT